MGSISVLLRKWRSGVIGGAIETCPDMTHPFQGGCGEVSFIGGAIETNQRTDRHHREVAK